MDKKIIIIGAGFAGLRCGLELKDKGFNNVKILEARNRVGGRVHTLYDNGSFVEAGGELIGRSHQEFINLAKRFNLNLVDIDDTDEEEIIVLKSGIFKGEDAKILMTKTEAVIRKIGKESQILEHPNEPWNEEQYIQDLDNLSFGSEIDKWNLETDVKQLLFSLFERDNLGSVYDQSWLSILCQMAGCGGESFWDNVENYRCQEGNQALAIAMAKPLDVILNTEVTKIFKDRDKIMITTVTSNTKQEYECDFVVIATPPSTWDNLTINPELDLKDYRVRMAPAMKFLFKMAPNSSLSHMHSDTLGEVWSDEPGHYPNKLSYDDLGFDIKSANYTVFTGGSHNCRILRTGIEQYTDQLSNAYNEDFTDNYICGKIVDWESEKYTKAGYSCYAVSELTNIVKNLNGIVTSHNIAFTGEACSPMYPGFMNGALTSGKNCAERIFKYYTS